MKALLINPPYAYSEIPIMPMGLCYIAAVLERSGNEVQILDLLVSRYSKQKIETRLAEYQPDIVGVTSVTMNYPIASESLKHCKDANRDITTVIGGPHVTFAPVETLNEAPWIDIVVRGEGENTMLDLVSGKKPEDIDGIAYRSPDGIKLTKPRGLIENLDELPVPARHLFPLSRYHALNVHASVIAGRGCPFNCIFCVGSKMGGRRVRYRDARLIVDEVEQALAAGFTEVNLEDDLITINHKQLYAFCDEVVRRGLKFNWSAFSRADTVNPELLRRMKQAGCTWLLYGVESGNQEILDTIKKKITLEKIREGVKMANEAGINILASFIIGLPGETKETLKQTVEFGKSLGVSYGFNVLCPFPGTEVREKADEYGIEILTNDWTKYDCNRPVSRTKGASPDDINATLHDYFTRIKLLFKELEKMDQSELTGAMKPGSRGLVAGALLRNDVIESLGIMKLTREPVSGLVDRLAEILPFPRQQISDDVTKWATAGLLKYDVSDGHLTWRWS